MNLKNMLNRIYFKTRILVQNFKYNRECLRYTSIVNLKINLKIPHSYLFNLLRFSPYSFV